VLDPFSSAGAVRAAIGFLAGRFPDTYNTEKSSWQAQKGEPMGNFDDFGKALEAELEHLKRFVTDEVVPSTRRATIDGLRTAASRLEELAADLERNSASKSTDAKPR
jgi:hypothetical protein